MPRYEGGRSKIRLMHKGKQETTGELSTLAGGLTFSLRVAMVFAIGVAGFFFIALI